LGVETIGVWPGADVLDRQTPYQEKWATLVASLGEVARVLKDRGTRLAVEYKPHELVANADSALRLCDSIGSPNIGVLLDTGHALWAAEDLPIVVRMLGSRLFHVHLDDTPGDIDRDLPPGRHHNFGPFFEALATSGYRGLLSLDMYGAVNDAVATGQEASREARDYVRAAIATAGLSV
jgi:sugar phosphate isomerase/epimerase